MKNLSALKYVVLVLAVLFPFSVFGDDSAITYNRIVQSAAHDYTAGFKFTVRDNPIMITELMGYSDATQVSIWAEGGGAPLRSVDLPDGPDPRQASCIRSRTSECSVRYRQPGPTRVE